jgi:hypothetical protein
MREVGERHPVVGLVLLLLPPLAGCAGLKSLIRSWLMARRWEAGSSKRRLNYDSRCVVVHLRFFQLRQLCYALAPPTLCRF